MNIKMKSMKKRVVIKIGTSTLTSGTKRISFGKIEDIASQIEKIKDKYDVVIVSSGAIAAAKQVVEISGYNKKVDSKQAMAAIGQPKLIRIYDDIFNMFGLNVSQCLMTYRDFENETSKSNTRNTINKLLEYGYIPIVNENDTVAVEEIVLGDNDKLSALVALTIEADLLIIASDIDGLFDSNPKINKNAKLIEKVYNIDEVIHFADCNKSDQGTGGMISKFQAAQICKDGGVEMWIVNGGYDNFFADALADKIIFTKFIV